MYWHNTATTLELHVCVVCCWCAAWTLVVAPRDRWTLVAPVTRGLTGSPEDHCWYSSTPKTQWYLNVELLQPAYPAHWANSMGDPRVLSNFLNWLIWCCFQCLKVGGAYIWKVPTFSNSFVLSEGNKEHIKRPWRNPFRIYINCISLVSKFVFVPLAAQLGWV